MAAVCPISARGPKYPAEVALPAGHAGQTRDAVILCHQLRTIDLGRVTSVELGRRVQHVTDSFIRAQVRASLARHLGLDIPALMDGAA
jgi:mRNA-degrading endonuclease toxin of MazEF toxin-antitoxin module